MYIDAPDTDVASDLADLWVDLAAEQRQYDSHIQAEANRENITENVMRAIVTDGMWVARADAADETGAAADEILGFVMFSVESGVLETDVTRGTIENLYVRPPYRGQGIGSQLLEAAHERLDARDIDRVKLEVMAGNDAARRFYRRHGYTPHRIGMERPTENDNHSKDAE